MPPVRRIARRFKPPGSTEWKPLSTDPGASDEDEAVARSNQAELRDALLKSLQMQNLVVLVGSGCSISAGGPSMGDLWIAVVGDEPSDEAKAIAATVEHDLDADQNIESFLSRLEAYLQIHDDEEVEQFLDTAKGVVLEQCTGFLDDERLEAHHTFLRRLSRRRVRDPRLKVFTTNYDLCFERATGDLGGVVLDGFSFTSPRRYDPRYFGYDIVRRPRTGEKPGHYLEGVYQLYKLHGSVNWSRDDDGNITEDSAPEPGNACLIYPARGKYQQSYTQPYLESMAQYLSAVREPNTCVLVAGFGFNDDHLSEPLLAAARTNPHLRLVIVDRSPKAKVDKGSRYWQELAALSERGEDIWMVQSSFAAFAEMIPDLQSLTPADSLMKAVKGAVGRP